MMKYDRKRPELLAPAGSPAALEAAIEGGADAIYVGGSAFNARINAKNFTVEDLKKGISLAHAYGVKVYVAANTLIFDREREDFLHAAEDAFCCGADALIVADIGAAAEIKRRIPIELHASTQLSGHNLAAADALAKAGFSRMVCAREMSEADLRFFTANSPIEAEVFVHGALCVCHSGQCLFSSVVGGRSGNRGKCAQPCRLPYRAASGASSPYPLSLKDLSLARHVPALIDMGIASLKIEGRMKSPEYVRDVTRIWRRLLDEARGADDREMNELAEIFSRGGFTDAYFRGKPDHAMLGVRSDSDKQSTRTLIPFSGITRKIPLSLNARIVSGEPITLSLQDGSLQVGGAIPQAAITAPLDRETVIRCLSKFGGTPYEVRELQLELEGGLMVPISALNALRRQLTEHLLASPLSETDRKEPSRQEPMMPRQTRVLCRSGIFYAPEEIPEEAFSFFDILYEPIERYDGRTNGVMLPPVIFDHEEAAVSAMLTDAKARGAEHLLVGNIGHLALARRSGLTLHGDFRLNLTNAASAAFWEEQGLEDCLLSPELTLPQMRDIGGRTAAIVYGRLPLMVTEKCVGKELGGCQTCRRGKTALVDRKKVVFPVLRTYDHRSLIFNSVPLYMADRHDLLLRANLTMQYFLFTDESESDIRSVITAYRRHTPAAFPIKRM